MDKQQNQESRSRKAVARCEVRKRQGGGHSCKTSWAHWEYSSDAIHIVYRTGQTQAIRKVGNDGTSSNQEQEAYISFYKLKTVGMFLRERTNDSELTDDRPELDKDF